MFTGIVETLGTVIEAKMLEQGQSLTLSTGFRDLAIGESVSVNGVCLTVVEATPSGQSKYFVSVETLRCTQLATLVASDIVNLERAMPANGRFSGHVVQGHVDALGEVVSVLPRGEAWSFEVRLPSTLRRYVVEKGSIALNGVSLTVNQIVQGQPYFIVSIMLIPHTWEHTNLSKLKPGSPINVEVDIMAKYLMQNISLFSPSNSATNTPEARH